MTYKFHMKLIAITLIVVPLGMSSAHAQSSSGFLENLYQKYLHFNHASRSTAGAVSCPADKMVPKCGQNPTCVKLLTQTTFENYSNCEKTEVPETPMHLVATQPLALQGMNRVTGLVVEENVKSFSSGTDCTLEAMDETQGGIPVTSTQEYKIDPGAKVEVIRGCMINAWNYKTLIKVTDAKGKEVLLVAKYVGSSMIKKNPGIAEIRACFSKFFGATASTEKEQQAFVEARRSAPDAYSPVR